MEKEFVDTLPPVRIQIDLNSRSRDGLVRARLSRVSGAVAVGSRVIVFEPEDSVAALGHVRRIDPESGFLYIDVDWSTLNDDTYIAHVPNVNAIVRSDGIGIAVRFGVTSGIHAVSRLLSVEYTAAPPELKPKRNAVMNDLKKDLAFQ